MNRLVILTNSPGEVSGWVKPVLEALSQRQLSLEIMVAVLPCPYASGAEAAYGATLPGVSHALKYKDLKRNPPEDGKNLILQLGGDPMFGHMLSRKMKCDWMIYTGRPKFKRSVKKYFLPDEKAVARFRKAKVKQLACKYVGNLILDSIPCIKDKQQARETMRLNDYEHTVAFLPGSRPFEYRMGVAFFTRAAQELMNRYENLSAYLVVAPTVDEQILKRGLDEAGIAYIGESRAEEIPCNNGRKIKIVREKGFAAIKASDLAVALPGTNNLQIAALGTPLLMVAPMNYVEEIPLDGIAGLIPFRLPGFRTLKKKLVYWANERNKYVSLPNRIAEEEIVPEHRRIMTPLTVAHLADELLATPGRLEEIAEGYGRINFEYGASRKIADEVERYFRSRRKIAIRLDGEEEYQPRSQQNGGKGIEDSSTY